MLPGQKELPGFEPRESELAKQLAKLPLKPSTPQKPCDQGLFSDQRQQQEMFK